MARPKLNWVRDIDSNANPISVRILNGLTFASFLSFLPVIFWKKFYLLVIATVIAIGTFMYLALFMLFAKGPTILRLWFPRIKRRWLPGWSDGDLVLSTRIIGAILTALMLFLILKNLARAFQHGR
jgi:hypothetical protein